MNFSTTMCLFVFNQNGQALYSVEAPFDEAIVQGLEESNTPYAILTKEFPDRYWMDTNTKEVFLRETVIDLEFSKTKAKADGTDVITITNIPKFSHLVINGEPHWVEDELFEITSEGPQTAYVTMGGRHRCSTASIEFVDLESLKADKWEALKKERENKLSVCNTSKGAFDSDAEAKANITGIVTSIMIAQSLGATVPDIEFKMHNNETQVFTAEEFIQASLEVSDCISTVYKHSWALKAHLDSLNSIDEIEELNWNSLEG